MKIIKALFVLLVSLGSVAQAQNPPQFTISTVVGSAPQSNISGTSAKLGGGLLSVAVDSSGNVFFAVQDTVMRLSAAGQLTIVAGNGTYGFSGDGGPATNAQLAGPGGVALDSTGNLYIADRFNNRIRKISNGVITTVVGNGTQGFGGDNGSPMTAMINYPAAVAVDSTGNLYIADAYNNRVRKVSSGVITTVAGNGTSGLGGDNGAATSALLSEPNGVTVDSAGNLYISDYGTSRIRKVTSGVITTIVGGGSSLGDNGPATSAQLREPGGVAIDSSGNIYIADTYNYRIRKVSNGIITTLAGNGTASFNGDGGPATNAQLSLPSGVAVDAGGTVYFADYGNASIRKISSGVITTVAGNGTFSGDSGTATSSELATPFGVALDSTGNLYIADTDNNRLREVSNGIITTVAGLGTTGNAGPASNSQLFSYPTGVAVDSTGTVYIADDYNHRVRKVSNGVITTIAGNGTMGFSGDGGPASGAELAYPTGVAVDAAGNIYIAELQNNRVRKVSGGIITTIVGNGTFGFAGDGGPATSAELANPISVAVDSTGNLYIADAGNSRIRKVSNGVITTIAGTGTAGFSGDNGTATNAQLNLPFGVAVDSSGNVYIADTFNHRIRVISIGTISTIAGTGTAGFAGDNGPAAKAELNSPINIAVAVSGSLYIADCGFRGKAKRIPG